MKQKYTIYKHTASSGKCYIGQTSCYPILKRWMPNPESKYRTSTKLRNAIRKYGWDDFSTEVLAITKNKNQANKLEAKFIRKFDSIESGYNLQSGGINFYHSSETKKKIGEGNKGKVRSEEFKKKLSEYRKKIMTAEYRAMLSVKCSGWSHTYEAKKKIGDNSRGKHYTLGRKQSDEEKQMRSIVAKNVAPMSCGHKRHNRYSKCIIKLKEIQNENNNDFTDFEDLIS